MRNHVNYKGVGVPCKGPEKTPSEWVGRKLWGTGGRAEQKDDIHQTKSGENRM